MEKSPENILQMAKSPKPDSSVKSREVSVETERLKQEIQVLIKGRQLEDLSEAELKTVLVKHRELAGVLGIKMEQESGMPDLEKLNVSIEPFLRETFTSWNSKATADKAQITPSFQNPKTQDWSTKETDIDPTKFGEYTLNPETQTLDFEKAKVIVPDLSAFNGKKLSEVAQHLIDTYGDKYHIPGIEYWQWLVQNPTKNPNSATNLKDGKWNFFFGSVLRNSNGHWNAPNARWNGSSWNRDGNWLGLKWRSDCRVVLLEKN